MKRFIDYKNFDRPPDIDGRFDYVYLAAICP